MHFHPDRIQVLNNGSSIEKTRYACNLRRLQESTCTIQDLLSDSSVSLPDGLAMFLLNSEDQFPSCDPDGTSFPRH